MVSDPITSSLFGRFLSRVLDDHADRRRLLDDIVPKAPPALRRAVEEWLEQPTTRLLLASDDEAQYRAAATSLSDVMEEREVDGPSDPLPIVRGAREALLDRQPAPAAVRRSEERIVDELHRTAEEATERTVRRMEAAGRELAGPLPPTVRALLKDWRLEQPEEAMWLASWLAQRPSSEGLQNLLASDSRLVRAGDPRAWEAVARYAQAHGHSQLAAEFWERAATVSPHPGRAVANQAFVMASFDTVAARELVAQTAAQGDAHLLADAVRLRIDEHLHELAELGQQADPDTPEGRLLGGLAVEALVGIDRLDEALELAERLADGVDRALARQQLAGVLFIRVQRGATERHSADLNRARELALEVRELRHRWGLPAPQATQLAMQISLQQAELHEIAELADRCHDDGWGADLDDDETAGLVALARTIQGAEPGKAKGLSAAMERFLSAVGPYLLSDETPPSDGGYVEALRDALELADDDDDVARILRALARVDAVPTERVEDLKSRQPLAAAIVEATALQARGQVEQAAALLRPQTAVSDEACWALAHLLEQDGQDEQVAEVVADSWARFHDVALLTFGLQSGVRADPTSRAVGRLREAAAQALSDEDLSPLQRRRLLRRLVELDSKAGRWSQVVEWCTRLREAGDDSDDLPWMLAQAHLNIGRPDRAWRALLHHDSLVPPLNGETARVLAGLAVVCSDDTTHVHALLSHRHAVDDVATTGRLILAALQLALRLGGADANQAAHAAVEAFLDEHPDNEVIQRVSADELLRPGGLEDYAPAVPAAASQLHAHIVTGRAPFAAVAALKTAPYAGLLVENDTGVLYAASDSVAFRSRERSEAAAALGGRVVLDLTALYLLARLELELGSSEAVDPLIAAFHRVELTVPAALDVANAAGVLAVGASGVVVPPVDGSDGRHQFIDIPEEVAQRRQQLIRIMLRRSEQLPRCEADVSRAFRPDDDAGSPHWEAAFGPADVGIATGQPSWVDDQALRRLLRPRNVPTFGTRAVLDVLYRDGRLSPAAFDTLRRGLRQGRIADLPAPADELRADVRASGFAVGPELVPLLQPGWWTTRYNMAGRVDKLFATVAREAPEQMPMWLHVATIGLWRRTGTDEVPARVLFHLLTVHPELRAHAAAMLAALDDALQLVGRPAADGDILARALRFGRGDSADDELLRTLLLDVDEQRLLGVVDALLADPEPTNPGTAGST